MDSKRVLVPLSSVASKEVDWLWRGRIPLGALTLMEGDPGQAKSSVAYDLAARVTIGAPMPDSPPTCPAAGVILLQGEDSLAARVRPALQAARADIDRVFVYDADVCSSQPLRLPDDLVLIESAARQIQTKLLVIDPMSSFFDCALHSERQIRQTLGPLQNLAERMQLAVLLIRHLNKSAHAPVMYRGAGSIAIIAAARSALMVANDPGTNDPHRHVLALAKSNVASAGAIAYRTFLESNVVRVEWLGASHYTAQDLATRGGEDELGTIQETAYVLYTILRHGPRWARDVRTLIQDAGLSWRTANRVKKLLNIRSRHLGGGTDGRWVWVLPSEADILRPFREREAAEVLEQMIAETEPVAGHGT